MFLLCFLVITVWPLLVLIFDELMEAPGCQGCSPPSVSPPELLSLGHRSASWLEASTCSLLSHLPTRLAPVGTCPQPLHVSPAHQLLSWLAPFPASPTPRGDELCACCADGRPDSLPSLPRVAISSARPCSWASPIVRCFRSRFRARLRFSVFCPQQSTELPAVLFPHLVY